MNYFDANSIYQKQLTNLQQNPDWKVVANNSVTTALLRSEAEALAEVARYAEYLYQESKWDTARNPSSILAMSSILGYQPKRKVSATGQIYVSLDPRTFLVGKTITSNIFKNLNSTSTLTDPAWIQAPSSYYIDNSAEIIDTVSGLSYVASSGFLEKEKCVSEKAVSILQGRRASVFLDIYTMRSIVTSSLLDPYLYFPVEITDCENADTIQSRPYFQVSVLYTQEGETRAQYYRVVNSLLLSTTADYDVEVYNDLYSRSLFYLKFNNDAARGNVLDLSRNTNILGIRIEYIESSGALGNSTDLFRNFTITLKDGTKLYGINLEPISGGADEETITEVKVNAPKAYLTSYTAGTKEAYENTILNTTLKVESSSTGQTIEYKPTKANVYKGSLLNTSTGNLQTVTMISFIADNLEDIITSYQDDYSDIEEALNLYLDKIKSPQDILKFSPPNYTPFALKVNCQIDREKVADINTLEEDIRQLIEKEWSPSSLSLDFNRSFFPSQIITDIQTSFPEVVAVETNVEAIKKLDWSEAERKDPAIKSSSTLSVHTCRIPFNFSNVFLGDKSIKGFKDYSTGSSYIMRLDIMYKRPSALLDATISNFHSTIFIAENKDLLKSEVKDGSTVLVNTRPSRKFYAKKENNKGEVWPITFSSETTANTADYEVLIGDDVSIIDSTYQFKFRPAMYDDNEFNDLISDDSSIYIPSTETYLVDPGTLDDYLVYFSGDYTSNEEGTVGEGWLEISFDPIYKMLQVFSLYDPELNAALETCPLSLLKCDTGTTSAENPTRVFENFRAIVADYVDIYVSMRPVDSNLKIKTDSNENIVLYIDSYDSWETSQRKVNLTADKRVRMIDVQCTYKE